MGETGNQDSARSSEPMARIKFLKRIQPFVLLVLVGLIISVDLPSEKKEEVLDAKVNIRVSWKEHDTQSGIIETGSYSIEANGTIKTWQGGSKHESLRIFVPSGLTATYTFENRGLHKLPQQDCPQLAFEVSGSGSVQVASALGGSVAADPSGTAFFNAQVMTGEAAKVGWHALVEDFPVSPEDVAKIYSDPGKDFCHFSFAPVTMKFHGKRQKQCTEYVDYEGKASSSLVAILAWSAEGASGSRHWNAEPSPAGARGLSLKVLDWAGIKHVEPEEKPGSHTIDVSWRFGKIKPIVKIKRFKKIGNEEIPEDITQAPDRDPQKLLVGRKVKLIAEVEPSSVALSSGRWEIEGATVSGYEADDEHGEVKLLDDRQKQQTQIEFAWVDGSLEGTPLNVKYSGTAGGDRVEATAEFKIFEPKASVDVTVSNVVRVGIGPSGSCSMYLGGKMLKTGAGAAGEPGIEIESSIEMPQDFSGEPYRVGYVQLIRESAWAKKREGWDYRLNKPNFIWQKKENLDWCLDTSYPYHYDWKPSMNDTPSTALTRDSYMADVSDLFETYLLFVPSSSPYGDSRCVPVPLKKIRWSWAGAVEREEDSDLADFACDEEVFKLVWEEAPSPWVDDCNKHPEWKCNVKNNKSVLMPEKDWKGARTLRRKKS